LVVNAGLIVLTQRPVTGNVTWRITFW
jgi:hypothetical protein